MEPEREYLTPIASDAKREKCPTPLPRKGISMTRTMTARRGRAYDCRDWIEFAVVEETIRGVKVRYTTAPRRIIDATPPQAIESTAGEGKAIPPAGETTS